MLPDLGKYTFVVLASYASTFVLVFGLIALSYRAWRRAKSDLEAIENATRNQSRNSSE